MDQLPNAEFFNLYGPTETNVCTWYPVPRPLPPDIADLPIGRACANTEVFAVDEGGRRVSAGGRGELHVRGPLVMLGYWGLPEKTREVLGGNSFQPAYHEAVYRTGDIVEPGADGNYRFLGRRDHMVKSRGYRIELGEVEQVLYQHERVREAVVLAVPDEEIGARLSAVVVPNEGSALSAGDLQAFCRARLPNYMVPEAFLFRGEIPRTSTGKADRVALSRELRSTGREG
jgi:acyl-CoA synthetase (AMP-forming)/AMP-acid ligase II